jgi:hypothetical protein
LRSLLISTLPVATESSFDPSAEFDNGVSVIVNKTNDTYEEYHGNLYPLIIEIESGLGRNILTVLGKTLDLIDVNKGKYEFRSSDPWSLFSDSITSFDGLFFKGDINIQANSSLISALQPIVEFLIDGKSLSLTGLPRLHDYISML